MDKQSWWVVVAVAGLGGGAVQTGTVLYVDDNAPLGGDGLRWSTAYRFLQDALANAAGVTEIRVAQGAYKPDQDERGNITPGDRGATFQLINGVALMGGFAGIRARDPDERDVVQHESILSGDLLDDDGPDFANNDENSLHVVMGDGTGATATLDGFTITAGNSDGPDPDHRGGGMLNYLDSSPLVANCTFSGNTSTLGAGMYNHSNSSPTVTNCTFNGNRALDFGGGMANFLSSPSVINCTFSGNSASNFGGGMTNVNSSSPAVANCTFSGNTASSFGGGMANLSNSSPRVTDCTFSENSISGHGGGMMNHLNSSPTVTNCTFSGNTSSLGAGMYNHRNSSPTVINCMFFGNTASQAGGGMTNFLSSPTVTNCTFNGNTAGVFGGGMTSSNSSSPTVANCILWGNFPGQIVDSTTATTVRYSNVQDGWPGAGSYNIDADPRFVDPDGPDDDPNTFDGNDYRLLPSSPCIDAADNSAVPIEIMTDHDGNPRVVEDPCIPDTGFGTSPIVDMGAYEWQLDILVDCNGNGTQDTCDILADPRLDCDGNLLVDSCEVLLDPSLDCNANGIHDACDIADGTSRDVNGNGRADECECLVDLSGDGQVESGDLFLLLAVWGLDPDGPPDFDGDGTVAVPDLLELLAKWGQCD